MPVTIDNVTLTRCRPCRCQQSFRPLRHHRPVQILCSFLPEHVPVGVNDIVVFEHLTVRRLLPVVVFVLEIVRGWTDRLSVTLLLLLLKVERHLPSLLLFSLPQI